MFFFDTEDFTSERSAEAIKQEAEICASEGVVGHFAVVGLLTQQLEAWGRRDIIDSLKPHIIGTHTYGHTLHPNICEVSDCADFEQAFENVAKYEDMALDMINSVFAPEKIMFACPPGNSKSYAAMYFYAARGIPFYCDTVVCDGRGSALHYCNQEHIDYFKSMESLFFTSEPDLDGFIEELYATRDRAIIYTHPNIAVKTEFWDALNYNKKNLRKFGEWIEAKDREPLETEKFYRLMRELIRKLKGDERFVITDLNEILKRRQPRILPTVGMLPKIRRELSGGLCRVKDMPFSLSEIFSAVVGIINGSERCLPPLTHGFLSEPRGLREECVVSAEGLRNAAAHIRIDTFIPEYITVDGIEIGPADFLMAALEMLTSSKHFIKITPREQLVKSDELCELKSFKMNGQWCHAESFCDSFLSDRLRLQCWTLRYEQSAKRRSLWSGIK